MNGRTACITPTAGMRSLPYMTLEQVFHYPTRHFTFHLQQIATDKLPTVSP
jgi:hypothetical protein